MLSKTYLVTLQWSHNWIWTYLEILFLSRRFPYLAASCRVTRFENHPKSPKLPLNFYYVFQVSLFQNRKQIYYYHTLSIQIPLYKQCLKIAKNVSFCKEIVSIQQFFFCSLRKLNFVLCMKIKCYSYVLSNAAKIGQPKSFVWLRFSQHN